MTTIRINKYTCDSCGDHVYTVDIDVGVTPFMIGCKATASCPGSMQSSFYQVPPDAFPLVSFEWFKPVGEDYRKLSKAMKDHVDGGGLDIRPIRKR